MTDPAVPVRVEGIVDHVVIVMSDTPQFQCHRCHASQATPPTEELLEFWEASDVFLEKHRGC